MRFKSLFLAGSLTMILASQLAAALPPVESAGGGRSPSKNSLEARLDRIERIVDQYFQSELLTQIETLQQENLELKGLLEEQEHALSELQKQQKSLFVELEKKMEKLSKGKLEQLGKAESKPSRTFAAVKTDDVKERAAYQAAYALVQGKAYQEAIERFEDYLWQYPDGQYRPNVYYWLGEVYMAESHHHKSSKEWLAKANQAFKRVVDNFPEHHKALDSMLKLGLIAEESEDWDAAKSYLMTVKNSNPNSSLARIAETKLQRLAMDGHI